MIEHLESPKFFLYQNKNQKRSLTDKIKGHILKERIDYIDQLNNVCGFCKLQTFDTPINLIGYSLTWRNRFDRIGGVGPLGVDKDYRHKNIAYNLLVSAINELIDRDCQKAIIDWTNLMELYRKFGFEIWKSYTYLQLNF